MTTSQEYDCDVLICGAGPVGLVLALALRRLGVDCRIVDKSPAPAATSRAFGLQPRVLEILAALDLLPALKQAGGRTYPGTSIIRGTTALPFMTYEDMPTTQRHMMMLEQNLSERVFAEQLVERGGVEVERATEVTGIEADAHGVTVALSRRSAGDGAVYDWYAINSAMDSAMDSASSNTASNDAINSISSNSAGNSTSSNSTNNNSTNNNGASDASAASGRGKQADEQADELITVRARFLVGADGAHSTVRKRMGWRFEGHTNSDQFTLADADVVTNLADTIGPVWGMRDTLVIFDLPNQQPVTPGARRVRIGYSHAVVDPSQLPLSHAQFVATISRIVPPEVSISISNITWMSTFKINERLSERYVDSQHRRVLIAGDAAHCHSPAGGQGLNLGIQDAFNLAWKLALAVRFGADRRLVLDTYEHERRPVAAGVLRHSGWLLRSAFGKGWLSQMVRDHVLSNLPAFVWKRIALRNAQLATHYGRNTLVDDTVGLAPLSEYGQPGRRFPDASLVDTATGAAVSVQRLFVSDAVFHILVMLPARMTADCEQRLAELETLVVRINHARPAVAVTVAAADGVNPARTVHSLAFVSVSTVAPSSAAPSSAASSISSSTPPSAARSFHDTADCDFQKAVGANAAMWPAQNSEPLVVLVRPDGVVGLAGSLAVSDTLPRIDRFLSQL